MVNVTQIVNNSVIPSDITNKITTGLNTTLLILKAIGILILIYILFVIIRWIADMLRNRRIKKIYQKVNEIDEKVNLLLERTQRNSKKEKKK